MLGKMTGKSINTLFIKKSLFCVIFLLFSASIVSAQEPPTFTDYPTISTYNWPESPVEKPENFVIHIESKDPKQNAKDMAKEIITQAEKYRDEIAQKWFGECLKKWDVPTMLDVKIYSDLQIEEKMRGARTMPMGKNMYQAGFSSTKQQIIEELLPHEITHMVFFDYLGQTDPQRDPMKLWFLEGSARMEEKLSPDVKYKSLKRFYDYISAPAVGYPIDKFLDMFRYPRNPIKNSVLYDQSWSLTKYLTQEQCGGKYAFGAYLIYDYWLKGRNWSKSFEKTYRSIDVKPLFPTISTLQNKWLTWVRDGSIMLDAPDPNKKYSDQMQPVQVVRPQCANTLTNSIYPPNPSSKKPECPDGPCVEPIGPILFEKPNLDIILICNPSTELCSAIKKLNLSKVFPIEVPDRKIAVYFQFMPFMAGHPMLEAFGVKKEPSIIFVGESPTDMAGMNFDTAKIEVTSLKQLPGLAEEISKRIKGIEAELVKIYQQR